MKLLAIPKAAPRKKLQVTLLDFTEGVTLDSAGMDPEPKSVWDMVNMDPLPVGGAMKRRTVKPFQGNSWSTAPVWVGTYTSASDVTWVVASFADGAIQAMNAQGALMAEIRPASGGKPYRGVVVNGVLVLQNGSTAAIQWDGTNFTTLGTAFSPTTLPVNPINAGIPIGFYSYVWRGRLWVLSTVEGNFVKRSRIRSSYQMFNNTGYRDFDPAHYLDLDIGKDSEGITGGAVTGDTFFIFKDHHVYKVDGSDWSDTNNLFSFKAITSDVGACSERAIAGLGTVTYFWDERRGAHAILDVPNTYGRFQYTQNLMGGLSRLIDEKIIPEERASEVTASVGVDKILFGVPWRTGPNRTLVYHVSLKCWSIYELPLRQALDFKPKALPAASIAVHKGPTETRILELESLETNDNLGAGPVSMLAYVRLAWTHLGYPTARKYWRRITVTAKGAGVYGLQALLDWDENALRGSLSSSIPDRAAGLPLVTLSRLRVAEGLSGYSTTVMPLCSGRALSLMVTAPVAGPWVLHSVTIEGELDGRVY